MPGNWTEARRRDGTVGRWRKLPAGAMQAWARDTGGGQWAINSATPTWFVALRCDHGVVMGTMTRHVEREPIRSACLRCHRVHVVLATFRCLANHHLHWWG